MRTTIDINDALLKLLRERARAAGRPFKDVVEESLRLGLSVMNRGSSAQAFRVEAHDLGLKPGFRGTSLNQLYDQLEAEQDASGS